MDKVLVIVDVQKEFDEYIQHDLVDALSKYAENFDTVYQIWDTHNNTVAPTHSFPNQIDSVPKKFGKKHFSDKVKEYIKNIEASSDNGRTFKLSDDGGYIVRVKNNHDWFYVNPEIIDLIFDLKGKKVILAGGAEGECLEDIYQTFKAFGLKVHINKKYTYNAKTTQEDSVNEVKNNKEDAQEIAIILNNKSEKEELIRELKEIEYGNYLNFVSEFPCVVYLDLKRGDASWGMFGGDDYNAVINNKIDKCDILNGVYHNPFTIKDMRYIIKSLTSGGVYNPHKPTYMMSKEERKKKFLYESFDPKKETLVFEPSSSEECAKAQEIAFNNGWLWGSSDREIMYTSKDESMFLTFNHGIFGVDKQILRIPKLQFLSDYNIDENKMDALRRNTNGDIIYTNSLRNLESYLSGKPITPIYKPKKFIY